jgi:hypothetical protein
MESAIRKFNDLINISNNYKSNYKIYMFLKDCAFRSIFTVFQSGNLSEQEKQYVQNNYSQFQIEVAQYNWTFNSMTLNEYQQFLNEFYSKINFNIADLNTIILSKELTENLSFFGNYDDLTQRRLEFFTRKINEEMKKNIPQYNYQQQNYSNNNMNQSMNINNNIGEFYEPKNNNNYIPELVNPVFNLPMRRNDPNFINLKAAIEDLIENATQELDYHKVDMARKNLEAAAYYVNNIIE